MILTLIIRMDVVTGCLVGIVCASLTLFISGLNTKEYVFFVPEDSEDPIITIPRTPTPEQSRTEVL